MTKKKGIFDIHHENQFIPSIKRNEKRNGLTFEQALNTVLRQLEVEGCRERTLHDYKLIANYYMKQSNVIYLEDITEGTIRDWLMSMDVKNSTRLTRLKCFKAFLSRCYDNGWFSTKFWRNIKIRVDEPIKEGATDKDVDMLLSVLQYDNFLDVRNVCAVLLMYRCGLRIGTIARMEESCVDFEKMQLNLDGKILKNHKGLIVPINEQMAYLLKVLIKQNEIIRNEYKENNNLLFITIKGKATNNSITSNSIQRQLRKYTLEFGIKNINPHALRRGFAKNLYNKSNNILLVSKALGHADLSVTTKYLHTDLQDISDELKDYL